MSDREGNGSDVPPGVEPERGPYVESAIIMTTVRIVAPFVLTLGLFVMFHGASSAGGGFQGGAIAGSVVLMLAFAFGIEPVRDWIHPGVLLGLMAVGVLNFVGIGLLTVALGGNFLAYDVIPIGHASKYSIELIELGIGAIVVSIVTGLFFAIAGGIAPPEQVEETTEGES